MKKKCSPDDVQNRKFASKEEELRYMHGQMVQLQTQYDRLSSEISSQSNFPANTQPQKVREG